MKCRTLIVLGLLSPSLALAQPVDSTKAPAKPDTKQPAAKAADPLNDSMIAQEKKVWESIAKQDWTTFGAFLADDFTEITPTGFHNKSATLTSIKDGKLGKHTFSEWKVTKLGENAALVLYKVEYDWAGADGKVAHDSGYCVSTWLRQGGKWLAVAHQETSPGAAASTPEQKKPEAAKPSNTDAAKPAPK